MNAVYTLALAGVLVAIGDISLAHWIRAGSGLLFAIGILMNLTGIVVYSQTLASAQIGLATATFLGLNILVVTLGGALVYREIPNLSSVSGMALLLVGIGLIQMAH